MLLSHVSEESSARFLEVNLYLRFIDKLSSPPLIYTRELASAKGLFFVHLYGTYEYTVTAGVQEALRHINGGKLRIADCHPAFLSLALDSECRSLADVGPDKTWARRRALFGRVGSSEEVSIRETLMPTSGGNPSYEHLCSIWETFCIRDPVVPRPELIGRIKELVESRNAIAHGRESASAVGGRFTIGDLRTRHTDISEVCSHLLRSFDNYLSCNHYCVAT